MKARSAALLLAALALSACAASPPPSPAKAPTAFDAYNAVAGRAAAVRKTATPDMAEKIKEADQAAFDASVACSSAPRLVNSLAALTGQ